MIWDPMSITGWLVRMVINTLASIAAIAAAIMYVFALVLPVPGGLVSLWGQHLVRLRLLHVGSDK